MAIDQSKKLAELGVEPMPGRVQPSTQLVEEFAKEFGLGLPEEYQKFLEHFGGVTVSATCPILEPTPFGPEAVVDEFFGFMTDPADSGDIRDATRTADGAPTAIPIASDLSGQWIYLVCSGANRGAVYAHDYESRSSWPEAMFRSRFGNLSPHIAEYLKLRRSGKLPKKPDHMAHFYRLADSFQAFLESCRPNPDDE